MNLLTIVLLAVGVIALVVAVVVRAIYRRVVRYFDGIYFVGPGG